MVLTNTWSDRLLKAAPSTEEAPDQFQWALLSLLTTAVSIITTVINTVIGPTCGILFLQRSQSMGRKLLLSLKKKKERKKNPICKAFQSLRPWKSELMPVWREAVFLNKGNIYFITLILINLFPLGYVLVLEEKIIFIIEILGTTYSNFQPSKNYFLLPWGSHLRTTLKEEGPLVLGGRGSFQGNKVSQLS